MNEAEGNEEPTEIDAILTVNLNTCDQYWVYVPHAREVHIGGPEFAYSV